ncbi:olfactory receptor 11H6-like [Pleurodeles waltl]|uniref:olfactory receptor 11H6-like n=1 Tax=Pleurodeles waltl TaxID=8319 RepID=UPI003709C50D
MALKEAINQTFVIEFILLGFPTQPEFQIVLFVCFLTIYTLTITGNILIITVAIAETRLHMPMYFFLANFSFLEIWYTTSTVPNMLLDFLAEKKTISSIGCFVQFYFFFSLGATECYLLTTMGFDRYLAICKPLHYSTIMNPNICIILAVICWASGFTSFVTPAILISRLHFCGPNVINHFICDPVPLVELSCEPSQVAQLSCYIITSAILASTFMFTVVSYGFILSTIFKHHRTSSMGKTVSTCASHLTVVILFYGSVMTAYVRPTSRHSVEWDKVITVFYSIITPLLNPFIYSLRNKEVIDALKRLFSKLRDPRNI